MLEPSGFNGGIGFGLFSSTVKWLFVECVCVEIDDWRSGDGEFERNRLWRWLVAAGWYRCDGFEERFCDGTDLEGDGRFIDSDGTDSGPCMVGDSCVDLILPVNIDESNCNKVGGQFKDTLYWMTNSYIKANESVIVYKFAMVLWILTRQF